MLRAALRQAPAARLQPSRRCGVLAMLDSKESFNHRESHVREVCSRMKTRGPDGQGFMAGEVDNHSFHWALAHQRLAIMDPQPRGNQPMKSMNNNSVVVANGEIYNFKKLYKEVLGNPETHSHSDSEVILHLWEKFAAEGTPNEAARKICESLDGMFAFVVIDKSRSTYAAGRDPHGIKPLYMGTSGGDNVMFASELKCLVDGGYTKVVEIPPGHFYTPTDGIQRYYEPAWMYDPNFTHDPTIKPSDLRDCLERSVVKRMMSDVDFGLFLSGGVDSCIVANLMRPHIESVNGKVPSFTVGQENSPDVMASRAIAKHLGYEHHERLFTAQEAFGIVEDVIYHLETYEPELIRSAIPNYFLAEHTAKHVKMVLTGEGADELFAGYVYFEDAPNSKMLQQELVRIFQHLGNVNLKRTDRMTMAHGLEARVPFLDVEMAKMAMSIDPELKMIHDREKRREKAYLRNIFTGEIPEEVLWRQKAMQCEGVGEGWVSQLQRWCEDKVSDEAFAKAAERFPKNPPHTKEEYFYRDIFDYHFRGMEDFVHVWEGGCRAGGAPWKSSAYTRKGLADTTRLTHGLQSRGFSTSARRGFSTQASPAATTLSDGLKSLLISNADDRTLLDVDTGKNMYHSGPSVPPVGSLIRSSCTCSPLTQPVHDSLVNELGTAEQIASAKNAQDLTPVMDSLRQRLANALDLDPSTQVILTASGTDAELVPLSIARELSPEASQVRTVITAKQEIGRGVVMAAAGNYFNPFTPLGGDRGDRDAMPEFGNEVKAMCLEARCEQGTLLDPCPGCTEAAEQAALAKEPVVIHSVQGTKTNARDPFPPVAPTAKAENLKDYFMVVDACQGRVTNEELKGWLDAGAMILLTGSKFYQGPPFSGAILVPGQIVEALQQQHAQGNARPLPEMLKEFVTSADIPEALSHWREQLPDDANRGTALRWLGAIGEIEAFQSTGSDAEKKVAGDEWRNNVSSMVAQASNLSLFEANDTIINFRVEPVAGSPLGMDDLKKVYLWLTYDLTEALANSGAQLDSEEADVAKAMCLIGQPVDVASDYGILRIALGSADLRKMMGNRDAVLNEDRKVVQKVNLIAKYFDGLKSQLA